MKLKLKYVIIVLSLIASCKKEISPGENINCSSDNEQIQMNPMELIDLGLSVKWGQANIGAMSVADCGSYFAWGELKSKSSEEEKGYFNSSYLFTGGQPISKYCTDPEYGTLDGNKVLLLADDVSNVRLGEDWRIPSDNEWRELKNPENCSWTWTTMNGMSGYKVQSKKPGFTDNWIFLPAGGEMEGNVQFNKGTCGSYWSSSLFEGYPHQAKCFDFTQDKIYNCRAFRYAGKNVRPVYGTYIVNNKDVYIGSIENEGFQTEE